MIIEELEIEEEVQLKGDDCLIIVDMQYDFLPGGALPVEEGEQIISGINETAKLFHASTRRVVFTQDWHPKGHESFASAHPGKNPGDEYSSEDGAIGPVLWPDHCVQGSKGAEFHRTMDTDFAKAIIRKGTNPEVDSYSAFLENDKQQETGLSGYLQSLNVQRIFLCGLALDYCVYFSALDGVNFGFDTYVIIDLSRGIDQPEGNVSNALDDMSQKGVLFTKHSNIT